MIECIIRLLIKKYRIPRDMATLFFYQVSEQKRVGHLLEHMSEFKTFKELKEYYLGGNESEL